MVTLSSIFRRAAKATFSTPRVKLINDSYLLPENQEEMNRLKTDISARVVGYYRDQLVFDDVNFTGQLSGSVHINFENNDIGVKVDSPYAMPVEFGLSPGHKVNFDALKKWVEGKLGVDPSESREVTFKIFNKIRTKGIKPKRPLKKAILRLVKNDGARAGTPIKRTKRSRLKKIINTIKKVFKVGKNISKNISKRGRIKT